jgi:hypothetical protein
LLAISRVSCSSVSIRVIGADVAIVREFKRQKIDKNSDTKINFDMLLFTAFSFFYGPENEVFKTSIAYTVTKIRVNQSRVLRKSYFCS